jgi:hypothetical protein
MPTDAQRRAVDRDLDCLIMSSGTDHEIAEDHGVSPEYVRERRRIRRQDLAGAQILHRARELAHVVRWEGTELELIEQVLIAALERAHRRAQRQTVADRRRTVEANPEPTKAPARNAILRRVWGP